MPLRDIPRIDEQQPWPTIAISTREREAIATPAPAPVPGQRSGTRRTTHPLAQKSVTAPPSHAQGAQNPPPLPPLSASPGGAGSVALGWLAAFPKGALIGATLFAIYYGFFLNRAFWLVDWHWAYLAGGVVLATILIRFDRMLILLAAVGLWYSRATLLDAPELFAVWIAGGIIGRLLYEALP